MKILIFALQTQVQILRKFKRKASEKMQSDVNKRRAIRQKKARRRRLKITFIVFLIMALITLVIMCFTVFFPIKRINVSGSKLYSNGQIIKASKLTTDDNLFAISEDSIEQNIRKALPYIDEVELKRTFPDAVILTVKDAKEFAYFVSGDKYYILSEKGYVLKQQSEKPDSIFEIATSGIDGKLGENVKYKNNREQELLQNILVELKNQEISIDKIDVSNALNITLKVEGRFSVILGNNEYIEEKIAHLAGMIRSIPDRKGKINLSMWTPTNSQGSFVEEKA